MSFEIILWGSYERTVSRLYLHLTFLKLEAFEEKFISKINSQNIERHLSDTRSTLCYEIIFS